MQPTTEKCLILPREVRPEAADHHLCKAIHSSKTKLSTYINKYSSWSIPDTEHGQKPGADARYVKQKKIINKPIISSIKS